MNSPRIALVLLALFCAAVPAHAAGTTDGESSSVPYDAARPPGVPLLWLDDSLAERPVNTIALHNLAGRPLALKMGADQRLLPPQGFHLQSFTEGQRSMNVQVAMQTGETWERVSNPQPVTPGFRILILLREGRRLSDGSINAIDQVTVLRL